MEDGSSLCIVHDGERWFDIQARHKEEWET